LVNLVRLARVALPLLTGCSLAANPDQFDEGAASASSASSGGSGCSDGLEDPETRHCYRYEEEDLTWNAANARCELAGGYLASLTSASEIGLVLSMPLAQGPWIGAHDMDGDGTYQWVSGEPLDGAPWATGEPLAPCTWLSLQGNFGTDMCDGPAGDSVCEIPP
jgi:hypothetical protein